MLKISRWTGGGIAAAALLILITQEPSKSPSDAESSAEITATGISSPKQSEAELIAELVEKYPEVNFLGHPKGAVDTPPTTAALIQDASGQDRWGRPKESFVNWEFPHVHPLDRTPDGSQLLAVNTADNSLMVFDISGTTPRQLKRIPVGVAPVTVRAKNNSEAWVVNHASDTISIVDLSQGSVVKTLYTEDEPADVVFAGSPQKAYVSCSQANRINIFNTLNLAAEPTSVFINGEDPRALSVSPDGSKVYVAVFESSNATTLINGGTENRFQVDFVSRSDSPYGGQNPPPNQGNQFNPPLRAGQAAPPPVGMIVRKNATNRWMDDNNHDWTRFVTGGPLPGVSATTSARERVSGWDLKDRDLAIIDTSSNQVTNYRTGLMNALMAMDVNPSNGEVLIVGTDATNEIRYEPNLKGKFIKVLSARVATNGNKVISDLNPLIDYNQSSLPAAQRQQSIGDPRGVEFYDNGSKALVTGMGSNNIIAINADGSRIANLDVGEGPTGIVMGRDGNTAYVLNKFEGSISVVNTQAWQQTTKVSYFDPTPAPIKRGRRPFYNTHDTSGQGQISCASCHIDGRTDRLAWDLGDPSKPVSTIAGNNFHPMKGPLLTQTLQDALRNPLLHWRGDVLDLAHGFTTTPQGLQGDDNAFTAQEVADMETFLDSIHFPSNPNRNLDNSYKTDLEIPGPNGTVARTGNAVLGAQVFENGCRSCHHGHAMRGDIPVNAPAFGIDQLRLAPTWRNFHERFSMWNRSADGSNSGFGTQQNGSFDSTHNQTRSNNLMAFMQSVNGRFPYKPAGNFAYNKSQDTHAAVGQQVMFNGTVNGNTDGEGDWRLPLLKRLADNGEIGLTASVDKSGSIETFAYRGEGLWQKDTEADSLNHAALLQEASANGAIVTLTAVPSGSAIRLAVDFDSDGVLNGDERNAGTNPFNAESFPAANCDAQVLISERANALASSGWGNDNLPASNAIDGSLSTLFHTGYNDSSPSLKLDLNASYTLERIELFNRINCCQERLRDINVKLFDADRRLIRSELLNPGGSTESPSMLTLPLFGAPNARYVEISRTPIADDGGNYLQLAEVKVFACATNTTDSKINIAPQGSASQSSTAYGGSASRAIDNNVNGAWRGGSVTHTAMQAQPWWQLDLGSPTEIDEVILFNRSGCCSERLSNGVLFVSDSDMSSKSLAQLQADNSVWKTTFDGELSRRHEFDVFQQGRFVRVQLQDTQYLSLAEVQVLSPNTIATNQAPVVPAIGGQLSVVGDEVSLDLNATDPDGDSLTYSATGLPAGLSIDPSTGAIGGIASTAASYSVTASASDGEDSTQISFDWQVVPAQTQGNSLSSGVSVSGSLGQGEWAHYTIDSTDSHSHLQTLLNALSSDIDLYVRADAQPTGHTSEGGIYDCESILGGNSDESCTLANSNATRWFVSVHAYAAGDYTLTATLQDNASTGDGSLELNTPVNGLITQDEWQYFTFNSSESDASLMFSLSNNSADIDLFIQRDSKPNISTYDCKSDNGQTADELCTIQNSGVTTWHVGVHGYQAGSYTLAVSNSTTRMSGPKDMGRSKSGNVMTGAGGAFDPLVLWLLAGFAGFSAVSRRRSAVTYKH